MSTDRFAHLRRWMQQPQEPLLYLPDMEVGARPWHRRLADLEVLPLGWRLPDRATLQAVHEALRRAAATEEAP
jgi:hypothetical protein